MKIKEIVVDECQENPCGQGGIIFDNDMALVDIHYQDCCENVYADWTAVDEAAKHYNFKSIKLESARGGFRFGDGRRMFYVPCYNAQNGYYSEDLVIQYGSLQPIWHGKRYIKEFVAIKELVPDKTDNIY